MYKTEGRIRYSECGVDKKATLTAIINYFQDCTSENSERLGVGVSYLKGKKRAWILNTWHVIVNRYPEIGEEVEVSTWATGFKGVFGPRNFCMKTKDGETLSYANTLWVYVDTETGRPIKPDEEEMAAYGTEPPLEMEAVSRKIKLPEELKDAGTYPIHKYHIDTNHHVNNSQYIQMAAEVLPENFFVRQLRVEYKKAAVYGDQLRLKYTVDEVGVVVAMCDAESQPYAIIEFTGEIRK